MHDSRIHSCSIAPGGKPREPYTQDSKRQEASVDLKGKNVIAIGERDGVQGNVIALVAEQLGAEVVFNITQCFV